MVFTYDSALATSRDQLRLRLGDVDGDDPLFDNSELDYILTLETTVDQAALVAIDYAIARLAPSAVDTTLGDMSVKASQMIATLEKRLTRLQTTGVTAGSVGAPFLGGISRADVDARDNDLDRVPPSFSRKTSEPQAPRSRVWP